MIAIAATSMLASAGGALAEEHSSEKAGESMKKPKGGESMKPSDAAAAPMFLVEKKPLMQMLETWPATSQQVARTLIKKYGLPDEATPTLLIWHDNGPWKRTIVHKEPVDHNFPVPHKDVVEQVINYTVPSPELADELATFDGSLYLDRTRGEMSAKCDKEGANILALNLADDIIKGKKTVEEARQAYGDAVKQAMSGKPPKIMTALQFEPPTARVAGDPDEAIIRKDDAG